MRELFLDNTTGKLFHFAETVPTEKLVDLAIFRLRAAPRSHNIDAEGPISDLLRLFHVLAFFRPKGAARRVVNAVLER
jgi:hypothetical protein